MVKTVNCQQCGAAMKATNKTEKSVVLQIIGVILFLIGLPLLILFPIGTIMGLLLMIIAARLGYRRRKVWLCGGCGYFFERA